MMRRSTSRVCVLSVSLFGLLLFSSLIFYSPHKAAPANNFSEGFDGIEPPFELPVGWTTSGFQATGTFPFHSPNNVMMGFASSGYNVAWYLTSPPITLGQISPKVVFHHNIQLSTLVENGDGCVLDIKIGNGAWTDIAAAGGTFIENGYTNVIDAPTNPLNGRSSWAGHTGNNFLRTEILLPSSARGQTIQLRWGLGLDNALNGTGWRIDSVSVGSGLSGENPDAIAIPSIGIADPYPSEAIVSGLSGWVTKATVTLENFSHTAPRDVDLLLVGPNGKRIVLMSDVGGSNSVSNTRLIFSDDAESNLPVDGPIVSGTYKPTNVTSGDPFPDVAPQGLVTGTSLATFRGMNPNGAWRLYFVDDSGSNLGAVTGGWGVTLETSEQCTLTLRETLRAVPAIGGSINLQFNVPPVCSWSAISNSSFLNITSPPVGFGDASLNVTVQPNSFAERIGVITVSRGDETRTILIDQMAGCPVPVTTQPQSFTAAGGAGEVQVSADSSCLWRPLSNSDWIQISDAPQTGSRTLGFSVLPNPYSSPRSGILSIGTQTITINQSALSIGSRFDFDGDSRADLSVFRPVNGVWHTQGTTVGYYTAPFGLSQDVLAPDDFDGDGKTDIAVYRDGVWYILRSTAGFMALQFGLAGDVPVPADYDGDGQADIAVFRSGEWYYRQSSNGDVRVVTFGLASDRPVPQDFNGDGRTDLAIYRDGTWWIQPSAGEPYAVQFGLAGDRAVPADYDGDRHADLAVYRAGVWYILRSSEGFLGFQFGIPTDTPVPADYDGDGRADIGVFRSGVWYVNQTTAGLRIVQFGLTDDLPTPAAYVR